MILVELDQLLDGLDFTIIKAFKIFFEVAFERGS